MLTLASKMNRLRVYQMKYLDYAVLLNSYDIAVMTSLATLDLIKHIAFLAW